MADKFTNPLSFFILFLFCLQVSVCWGQDSKKFKIHTIAFYNLENLFDTINDPTKFDEASPIMELSSGRGMAYKLKVRNMAKVIADIGYENANNCPAILGVCEVENRQVLMDLVNDSLLISKNYGIIHYDSPDQRGIDVGLIYQKNIFQPLNSKVHTLKIVDDYTGKRIYTRDQLVVSGMLENEPLHLIVNHWPSRSGGERRSRGRRIAAARLNQKIIDSLRMDNPYAKIITMGDFNDDPTSPSLKRILKTQASKSTLKLKDFYNPYEQLYKHGLGTNAYWDAWSLFDQMILSASFIDVEDNSFRFYKAFIYNKQYITTQRGRYKGYPFRSWGDEGFTGGYSDHFPVYIYLIKEILEQKKSHL